MNGILGLTELVLDSDLTPPNSASGWEWSRRRPDALLAIMLNDILDFSKIEAGHLDLDHVAVHRSAIFSSEAALQKILGPRVRDADLELACVWTSHSRRQRRSRGRLRSVCGKVLS